MRSIELGEVESTLFRHAAREVTGYQSLRPRVAATFRRGPLDGVTLPVAYPSPRNQPLVFEAELGTRQVRAVYSAARRWGEWELAQAIELTSAEQKP